jgi:hypothetical protein
MTQADFDAFVEKLRKLPPMGSTPAPTDVDFWKELDAMQSKQTKVTQ